MEQGDSAIEQRLNALVDLEKRLKEAQPEAPAPKMVTFQDYLDAQLGRAGTVASQLPRPPKTNPQDEKNLEDLQALPAPPRGIDPSLLDPAQELERITGRTAEIITDMISSSDSIYTRLIGLEALQQLKTVHFPTQLDAMIKWASDSILSHGQLYFGNHFSEIAKDVEKIATMPNERAKERGKIRDKIANDVVALISHGVARRDLYEKLPDASKTSTGIVHLLASADTLKNDNPNAYIELEKYLHESTHHAHMSDQMSLFPLMRRFISDAAKGHDVSQHDFVKISQNAEARKKMFANLRDARAQTYSNSLISYYQAALSNSGENPREELMSAFNAKIANDLEELYKIPPEEFAKNDFKHRLQDQMKELESIHQFRDRWEQGLHAEVEKHKAEVLKQTTTVHDQQKAIQTLQEQLAQAQSNPQDQNAIRDLQTQLAQAYQIMETQKSEINKAVEMWKQYELQAQQHMQQAGAMINHLQSEIAKAAEDKIILSQKYSEMYDRYEYLHGMASTAFGDEAGIMTELEIGPALKELTHEILQLENEKLEQDTQLETARQSMMLMHQHFQHLVLGNRDAPAEFTFFSQQMANFYAGVLPLIGYNEEDSKTIAARYGTVPIVGQDQFLKGLTKIREVAQDDMQIVLGEMTRAARVMKSQREDNRLEEAVRHAKEGLEEIYTTLATEPDDPVKAMQEITTYNKTARTAFRQFTKIMGNIMEENVRSKGSSVFEWAKGFTKNVRQQLAVKHRMSFEDTEFLMSIVYGLYDVAANGGNKPNFDRRNLFEQDELQYLDDINRVAGFQDDLDFATEKSIFLYVQNMIKFATNPKYRDRHLQDITQAFDNDPDLKEGLTHAQPVEPQLHMDVGGIASLSTEQRDILRDDLVIMSDLVATEDPETKKILMERLRNRGETVPHDRTTMQLLQNAIKGAQEMADLKRQHDHDQAINNTIEILKKRRNEMAHKRLVYGGSEYTLRSVETYNDLIEFVRIFGRQKSENRKRIREVRDTVFKFRNALTM